MRVFVKSIILIFTGFLFMGTMVQAGESENIAMLKLLLSGKPAETSQFDSQFLDAVPLEQLNAVLKDLSENIGTPTQIIPINTEGTEYEVRTNSHTMPALIVLDGTGKVAGLFFRPPIPLNAQLPELLTDLEELVSDTSYLIIKDGIVLVNKDADRPMAIGSAFKLGILRALQIEIEAGNIHWNDTIILEDNLRSLPSGILQDFPNNSPFTIHTLASLMISQSDNTATDMLLSLLGRNKVSEHLNGQYVLSTRELFQLKGDQDLARKFSEADNLTKVSISEMLMDRPLPSIAVGAVPYMLGVEWYLSAEKLCALIGFVKELDVFSINPGPADANAWKSISYKGGSEIGVLNLTSWLEGENGQQYCVVYTANDSSALPETDAITAYASLIAHLAIQN